MTRLRPALALMPQPTSALPVKVTTLKRSSRTSDSARAPAMGRTETEPSGKPAFAGEFGQAEGGERGLTGGLDDDAVARGESRDPACGRPAAAGS